MTTSPLWPSSRSMILCEPDGLSSRFPRFDAILSLSRRNILEIYEIPLIDPFESDVHHQTAPRLTKSVMKPPNARGLVSEVCVSEDMVAVSFFDLEEDDLGSAHYFLVVNSRTGSERLYHPIFTEVHYPSLLALIQRLTCYSIHRLALSSVQLEDRLRLYSATRNCRQRGRRSYPRFIRRYSAITYATFGTPSYRLSTTNTSRRLRSHIGSRSGIYRFPRPKATLE